MPAKQKIGIRISQEDFDNLDEVQQAVLSKLGIKPKETAKDRRRKKFFEEAETYILGVYNSCSLCSREWSQKWKMVPTYDNDEDEPYWQGVFIPNGHLILEDKKDDRMQISCSQCYERLAKLSKQALIKKLIAYARHAASWGGGK